MLAQHVRSPDKLVGHSDPARGHCGAVVTSGCSASSGFGDDEIVSRSRETMTNPAMTAPTTTHFVKQLTCQSDGTNS